MANLLQVGQKVPPWSAREGQRMTEQVLGVLTLPILLSLPLPLLLPLPKLRQEGRLHKLAKKSPHGRAEKDRG